MSCKRCLVAVLIVASISAVDGCSKYRVSRLPSDASAGESGANDEAVVQVEQTARVILTGGASLEGRVVEVSPESITFGKAGNYGLERTVVGAADIERLEIRSGSLSGTVVAGVLSVAAVAMLVTVTAREGPEPYMESAK